MSWRFLKQCLLRAGCGLWIGGFFSGLGAAATFYVATNGNDTNPGTASSPFRTLKRGWAAMAAGDTLLVRAGIYEEQLFHGFQGFSFKSGTSSGYSTMRAYSGETVIIRPRAASDTYRVLDFNGGVHHIEIDGFILDGVNVLHDAVKINKGQASYIRIKNSEIKNAPENGILGGDAGCEILSNDIHHNGTTRLFHNIYWGGKNSVIRGNHIHHSSGYGISLFAGSYGGSNQGVDDNLIEANLVYENGKAQVGGQYTAGILLSSGLRNKAVSNVIHNEFVGLQTHYGGDDASLISNKIYSCGVGISINAARTRVDQNIACQNQVNFENNASSTVIGQNTFAAQCPPDIAIPPAPSGVTVVQTPPSTQQPVSTTPVSVPSQALDSAGVYVPLLVPRQSEKPAVTGVNSVLAAAGLTAAGLGLAWMLSGPGKKR